MILSAVAIWWAVSSFHQQDVQNERHLSIQIKQQSDSVRSQRETAEAQLASSLLAWLKCENTSQRLMAQQVLGSISPREAFLVERDLARCPMAAKDRKAAEKYSLQSSLNELERDFLQQLSLARQYRSVGLQRRAVEEYERSYNQLPESFSSKVDPSTSARALEAMFSGEFSRSSDLFEEAFRLVETP